MAEEIEELESALDEVTSSSAKRAAADRSTIAFPYVPLDDAIAVARTIFESGIALSRDQIAGILGAEPASGGFRLKLSAARTFKLIDNAEGKYELTELGVRILSSDDTEARIARRDAFVSVPLYQRAFEAFKGRALPSRPVGLESAFVNFGVAPKQKDKARLAFEKSAQSAGFFNAGKERLVEPILGAPTAMRTNGKPTSDAYIEESTGASADVMQVASVEPGNDPLKEPLIHGLLIRLPKAGTNWDHDKRARWLKLLASVMDMVYTAPEEKDGVRFIQVEVVEL